VISAQSHFLAAPIVNSQRRHLSSSSSEENEATITNNHTNKQRNIKTDSDSSTKDLQKRKISRSKNKTTTSLALYTHRDSRIKSKCQKVNNEDIYGHNKSFTKEAIVFHNGVDNKITPMTPPKDSKHSTSDSGITSGVSTTEKNNASTTRGRTESSDRERTIKNLEWFKKKVDVARRGYRKRIMLPTPSSSESSDN
jgi:hypothetical protein